MAEDKQDPMEVDVCVALLNEALTMQNRSVVEYTMAAGAVGGLEFVGLVERFWLYAQAELADARRFVEKITALGGDPATDVAKVETSSRASDAVDRLIDSEREVIAKLHEVIPHTGQEPRSEALEHFLEHVISRKQEQVDQLLRAVGRTE
jgi:bacterioferritin (cytochrome b1)